MKKQALALIFIISITLFAQYEWSASVQISDVDDYAESAITIDNNGVLSALWCKDIKLDVGFYSPIYFSQSFNHGISWTTETNITPSYNDVPVWELRAVTDSKNNIHILYAKGLENKELIYKRFNGVSWTDDYIIDISLANSLRLGIDNTDKLFATWTLNNSAYYTLYDSKSDSIIWAVPQKIHPDIDYRIGDFTFSNIESSIYAIGTSGAVEDYRPYYLKYDISANQWTDFIEVSNYQEKTIGCAIAISDSDSIFVNLSVGYSSFENIDNVLTKYPQDSIWSNPIATNGYNNDWKRKMYIDKKNTIHLFERHRNTEGINSLTHTYREGSTWNVETIHIDPDYYIFWFDVKRRVFENYDEYYILYCKSRAIDGTEYNTINFQTKQISTGIQNLEDSAIINNYALYQNYPNPFNNQTTINYALQNISEVEINVFNAKGELVQNLVNKKQEKGRYSVLFKANKLNSGVYYYRLKIDGIVKETKKMLYLQ